MTESAGLESSGWQVVTSAGVGFFVSYSAPIGVIRRPDAPDEIVTWPDLDLGTESTEPTVAATPTGVWVTYSTNEFWQTPMTTAAVHLGLDGTVSRLTGLQWAIVVGATRHGLWLRSAALSMPPFDDPVAWSVRRDLTILSPTGESRTLSIDRVPEQVVDDGSLVCLRVFDDPPTRRHEEDGDQRGPICLQIALAPELPSTLLHQNGWQLVDFASLRNAWAATAPLAAPAPIPDLHIKWPMAALPAATRRAAVDELVEEFAHLDRFWADPEQGVRPLVVGLTDPRVVAIGAWPHTVVECTFRHPWYPGGRIRRTLPVYDVTGRRIRHFPPAIQLMEDLHTQHLPPISEASDGVLDISRAPR